MSGPPPKRSDQRRRRNSSADVETAEGRPAEVPELPPDTHPTARKWFESLAESGQSVFFQASDWATAVVAAELLSEQLLSSRPNAQMVGVWASISSALLCTEGDRRRMRIELSRPAPEGEEAADVSDLTAYRERIARESS